MARRLLVAVLAVFGLLGLAAAPAFATPLDLRVTTATCGGVTIVAHGLPHSSQVFLLVRDLQSGKAVSGAPIPATTDSTGSLARHLSINLRGVRAIDASVWNKRNETLTMVVQETSHVSCGRLPMTGGATVAALGVGLGLVAAGAAALWLGRRRPRRA
jgi:LPXTG-motif cell wall-anchored protein